MSQYYYTVASLPFLDFDADPPLTIPEFLADCKKECKESDYALVKKSSLIPYKDEQKLPEVLIDYYTWERSLRNELVLLRAKNMGISPDEYIRSGITTPEPAAVARNAFHQESPLSGEIVLQRARWALLDELELGHYFDIQKLIIYKLKLEILSEKAKVNVDNGKEVYNRIMNNIEQELNSLEKNHD